MKNKRIVVLSVLVILLLSGCGAYLTQKEQEEAIFYATQNAQFGVIPPPKYQTLAAEYYGLRLTATPMGTATPNPNYSPTPNAFQYAQTADAMVQSNQMTQQAQQYQYELQKAEAEKAAVAARETAMVHSQNMTAFAQATQVQATAFAEGTQVMGTAYAQGTATERAFVMQGQASATALAFTQVVAPTNDLLTLQAARIMQTVEAGEAQKVELAVKRQSAKNYFDAFLPWTLIVALAWVAGRGFATWVKTRTHPRDEHGRQQTFTRELPDGGVVMVKPEQMETGLVKITKDGSVIRYAPMDAAEQSKINKHNQFVESIAALPDSYAQQAPKLLMSGFEKGNKSRVNFRADVALSPVLDEADEQFLGGNGGQ
jgi:hypothetical protein